MKRDPQKGIGLMLALLTLGTLGMLIVFVSSLSIYFYQHSRTQNTLNAATLIATEQFFSNPEFSEEQRLQLTIEALQKYLSDSKGKFLKDTTIVFDADSSDADELLPNTLYLQTGRWTDNPHECVNGEKSCFMSQNILTESGSEMPVNSLRLNFSADMSFFSMPFGSILPVGGKAFEVSSTSVKAARCMTFVVDVSGSGHSESHRYVAVHPELEKEYSTDGVIEYSDRGDGTYEISLPENSGTYLIPPIDGTEDDFNYSCSTWPFDASGNVTEEFKGISQWEKYWCQMKDVRPKTCIEKGRPPATSSCDYHYKSDYKVTETKKGKYLIDRFNHPEPFSSFMLAINASLRRFNSTRTSLDKVAIMPLSRDLQSPIPPEGMTDKVDLLIDMTDLRRLGDLSWNDETNIWELQNEEHPNALDLGWFPSFQFSGTDIVGGLNAAIKALSDTAYCPSNAIKQIVLITDGIGTEYYSQNDLAPSSRQPISSYANLQKYTNNNMQTVILDKLVERDIQLISLLAGTAVEPNFMNQYREDGSCCYSIKEMVARGFGDSGSSGGKMTEGGSWVKRDDFPELLSADEGCASNVNATWCSYNYVGISSAVHFRRPNRILARLSNTSKGLFCPLMQPYRNNDGSIKTQCYDENGKWKDGGGVCERKDNKPQFYSITAQGIAGQAIDCLNESLYPGIGLVPSS